MARLEDTFGANAAPGGRLDALTGEVTGGMGGPGLRGGGGPGGPAAMGASGPGRPAGGMEGSNGTTQRAAGQTPPSFGTSHPVDRRVMRSILAAPLTSHITYSSALTSYTLTPTSVIAHFSNSTSAEGSLLVASDGNPSKVAAQLIGTEAHPLDTGSRMIYGKTPLSEVEGSVLPTLSKGMALVFDETRPSKLALFLETMRFKQGAPGVPEDYVYWVLAADSHVFGPDDAAILASHGAAAAAISLSVTEKWDPRIKLLLERQIEQETAVLRMTTSNPDALPVWKTQKRVTLMGDAVHCMPPTGGSGANTALRDAALLGRLLAGEKGPDGWTLETIKRYEEQMREYAGEMVRASYVAAVRAFGGYLIPGIRAA